MTLDSKVSEYGMKPTSTVHKDETVGYLITEMEKYRYRRFPVVNDNNKPVGMVTSSDILGTLHQTANSSFLKLKVSEIMSDKIVVVQHDDTVRSVIEVMYNIGISGVPILKDGEIKGIFTEKDVLLIDALWKGIQDPTITPETGPGRPVDEDSIVTEDHTFWQIADKLVNLAQRQILVKESTGSNYLGIVTIMTLLNAFLGEITLAKPNFEILQNLSPVQMTLSNLFQRSSPILLSSARLWMNSRGIEAFPLFNRGKPVKLITEKDLIGFLANNLS